MHVKKQQDKNRRNHREKGKIERLKISSKLYLSYSVLVLCILLVGTLAYSVASKAVMGNYRNSMEQSLDMLGNYLEYGFSNVETTSKGYFLDEELGNYLKGKMIAGEELVFYNKIRTDMVNKVTSDLFISNIYILSDEKSSISTAQSSCPDIYEAFVGLEEGQQIKSDMQNYHWMGRLDFVNEKLGIEKGSYAIRLAKQFYKQEAVMIMDIRQDIILENMRGIEPGEGSQVLFVTGDDRVLDPKGDVETDFIQTQAFMTARGDTENRSCVKEIVYGGEKQLFLYRRVGNTNAALCVLIPHTLLASQVSGIKYITVGIMVAALLLAVLVAVMISAGINRSISHMSYNMKRIAEGDMSVRIKISGKSEFAKLSAQMNQMLDSVSSLLENIKEVSRKVSDSAGSVNSSSFSIRESTVHIAGVMRELEKGVNSQSSDTVSCCLQLDNLAERINEVADSSKDMEVITGNTKQYIEDSKNSLESLKHRADETTEITYQIIGSIENMKEKSGQADQIISAVYEIAEETDLLALNASIESARAGSMGKGFQVIAEEIRKLSEQTIVATGNIRDIVKAIESTTLETFEQAQEARDIIMRQQEAVGDVSGAFENMIDQLKSMMVQVSSIAGNATEMGGQKEAALKNMENISNVTQAVADSVGTVNERTGRQEEEAGKLTALSDEMQRQVDELEKSLQRFSLN